MQLRIDPWAERHFAVVQRIVTEIRNVRSEYKIPRKSKMITYICPTNPNLDWSVILDCARGYVKENTEIILLE